uniref:Secreted protein n=1 Tax=Plectus sambesii TaxID=2011161 RepID=A0A914URE3_9BILA
MKLFALLFVPFRQALWQRHVAIAGMRTAAVKKAELRSGTSSNRPRAISNEPYPARRQDRRCGRTPATAERAARARGRWAETGGAEEEEAFWRGTSAHPPLTNCAPRLAARNGSGHLSAMSLEMAKNHRRPSSSKSGGPLRPDCSGPSKTAPRVAHLLLTYPLTNYRAHMLVCLPAAARYGCRVVCQLG